MDDLSDKLSQEEKDLRLSALKTIINNECKKIKDNMNAALLDKTKRKYNGYEIKTFTVDNYGNNIHQYPLHIDEEQMKSIANEFLTNSVYNGYKIKTVLVYNDQHKRIIEDRRNTDPTPTDIEIYTFSSYTKDKIKEQLPEALETIIPGTKETSIQKINNECTNRIFDTLLNNYNYNEYKLEKDNLSNYVLSHKGDIIYKFSPLDEREITMKNELLNIINSPSNNNIISIDDGGGGGGKRKSLRRMKRKTNKNQKKSKKSQKSKKSNKSKTIRRRGRR
jgi:hypothetical protein